MARIRCKLICSQCGSERLSAEAQPNTYWCYRCLRTVLGRDVPMTDAEIKTEDNEESI